MRRMLPFQRSAALSGSIVLVLLAAVGCSRPVVVPAEGASSERQAPFRDSQPAAMNSTGDVTSRVSISSPHQERSLPFHEFRGVPTGTLVSVRLQTPIAVGVPIENDAFEAILEQAIVIDGNTLIPKGTSVAGRVESVFISQMEPHRGYVRLALESVHLGEIDVPLQTASLFARQTSVMKQQASTIRLEKGRRLTFRLTEPISLSPQPTEASR